MTVEHNFELGDNVVVTIPPENREWGYDPCPDGTVAEVVELQNQNPGWVGIKLPDGRVHYEFYRRLKLVETALTQAQNPCAPNEHSANWYVGGKCGRCGDID